MVHESVLRDSALLGGLDRRTQSQLLEQGARRTYQPGDVIVRQGDTATALYLILRGRVEINREMGGAVVRLGEQGPGSFFGELALIEQHPRTASVTAKEETECLLIVAWEFTALMHEYPQITEALLRELIARIHRQEHHVF